MSNKQNVPEVRFKGFSDSWESSSLNKDIEVLDGDRGHNYPSTGDLKEQGHTLFLSASNVTKRGFELNYKQYITLEKSQSLGNGKLVLNDIILTSRGSVGHIAWYDEVVKQKVPYARINSGMLILRSNCSMCPSIVSQYLKSPKGAKKINLISFGSAQPQLTKASVSKLNITIPDDKTEQSLVGNYFQKLDTLINQHQQKHDKLSNLKKSMLEKMFPAAGETVPEIRFDGFSGDWKEVPFFKSFSFLSSNTLSRAELNYERGKARNIHYGDILIKFGDVVDAQGSNVPYINSDELVSKMSAAKLQDGDVLFADAAEDETVGKCVEVTNVGEETVFSGLHTIATRPNQSFATNYLGYYLNSGSFHQQLLPLMQGTKVLSISKKSISTVDVRYPSDRLEQERIGQYFHNLDVLINQHQQQITKLKNIKQACLDKMFV